MNKLFNKLKHKYEYRKVLDANILQNHKMYWYATSVISIIELCFLIRGFLVFDFSIWQHFAYMVSYGLLFFTSAVCSSLLLIYRHNTDTIRKLIKYLQFPYCVILVAFSVMVSLLDCSTNETSHINYPIVYIVVLFSIASIGLLSPYHYTFLNILSFIALFIGIYIIKPRALSSGFCSNMIIFEVMSLFVSFRIYYYIYQQYEMRVELDCKSKIDFLTNLYNRRSLDLFIDELYDTKKDYCFILLDIDHFKSFNDLYGHKVGDECLIFVATHLKKIFGEHCFRYGGDEFAVISFLSIQEIENSIERLNEELKAVAFESKLSITAGMYYNNHGYEPKVVFNEADKKLYENKKSII